MKKRQIIIIGVAIAILFIGRLVSIALSERAVKPPRGNGSGPTTVFVETVSTGTVPIHVSTTGMLEALERMELFSEVQGVMLPDGGRYRPGTSFSKGQILISIRADDQRAQLVSRRSAFERLLTSVLPDLRVDLPDAFPAWDAYLRTFDLNTALPDLPAIKDQKLKMFLTGRNVFSEFHAVRNLEVVLSKYTIRAPYDGVLVEANVDPGTVIRPGQSLGLFISPGVYELEASVSAITAERLHEGQDVELALDGSFNKVWNGKIARVNRAIDPESQMSSFFVRVEASDLKDGLFMQARVKAAGAEDAYELPRSLLIGNDQVFVVKEGRLLQKQVEPVHFSERSVVVRGLTDGAQVLSKVPPGAFEGMSVTIYKDSVPR